MLVVVCGMHRSGSTLVAQLAKGLLSSSTDLRISMNGLGDTIEEMQARARDPQVTWLAKVHVPRRELRRALPAEGMRYLYTYRDVRDALASAWRKNRFPFGSSERGAEIASRFVKEEIDIGAFFEARQPCWIGRYEEIVHDLPGLVQQLARFLEVELNQERCAELVAEASPEKQRERARLVSAGDRRLRQETFITTNHITDGRTGAWKESLSVAEAIAAEEAGRSWLRLKGYPLSFRKSVVSPLTEA